MCVYRGLRARGGAYVYARVQERGVEGGRFPVSAGPRRSHCFCTVFAPGPPAPPRPRPPAPRAPAPRLSPCAPPAGLGSVCAAWRHVAGAATRQPPAAEGSIRAPRRRGGRMPRFYDRGEWRRLKRAKIGRGGPCSASGCPPPGGPRRGGGAGRARSPITSGHGPWAAPTPFPTSAGFAPRATTGRTARRASMRRAAMRAGSPSIPRIPGTMSRRPGWQPAAEIRLTSSPHRRRCGAGQGGSAEQRGSVRRLALAWPWFSRQAAFRPPLEISPGSSGRFSRYVSRSTSAGTPRSFIRAMTRSSFFGAGLPR
jgi:hypothetical protein